MSPDAAVENSCFKVDEEVKEDNGALSSQIVLASTLDLKISVLAEIIPQTVKEPHRRAPLSEAHRKHAHLLDFLALILVRNASGDVTATALLPSTVTPDGITWHKLLYAKNTIVSLEEGTYALKLANTYGSSLTPDELRARLEELVYPFVTGKFQHRLASLRKALNTHQPALQTLTRSKATDHLLQKSFGSPTPEVGIIRLVSALNKSGNLAALSKCAHLLVQIHACDKSLGETLERNARSVGAYCLAIETMVHLKKAHGSQSRIEIQLVQADPDVWTKITKHPEEILNEVFEGKKRPLRVPTATPRVLNFPKRIHAECRLAAYILQYYMKDDGYDQTVILGASKLSCYPCYQLLATISEKTPLKIYTSSSHGKSYKGWTVPTNLPYQVTESFETSLETALETAYYQFVGRQRDSTPLDIPTKVNISFDLRNIGYDSG